MYYFYLLTVSAHIKVFFKCIGLRIVLNSTESTWLVKSLYRAVMERHPLNSGGVN